MSREQQPDGTCYDALNVLPFDRFKRLRVGQRPGTTETFAGLSGAVNGMAQVVLGQADESTDLAALFNPSVSTAPDHTFLENWVDLTNNPFTWDVGTSNTNTAGIATYLARFDGTRSGTWPSTGIHHGPPIEFNAFDQFALTSYQFNPGYSAGANGSSAAFTTDAATPADDFIVMIAMSGGSDGVTYFSVRVDQANPTATSGIITVEFDWGSGSVKLYQGTTLIASTTAAPADALVSAIQINGDSVLVFADASFDGSTFTGIQIISTTISGQTTTHKGVGFGHIFSSSDTTGITVGQVTVMDDIPGRARDVKLVATSAGSIWVGTPNNLADVSDGQLNHHSPGITDVSGHVYMVDGTHTLDLDLSDNSVVDFVASTGTVPAGNRIARTWRGRLALAAADDGQENFYFSRAGDATDWDFSQTDPAAAFAGNASTSGRVGDIILDMVPFNDDTLWIMGDHTIWAMAGDPGDGGSIVPVSPAIGILGTNAWTIAPDGSVWFVGTGGVYHATSPEQPPELVSGSSFPQFFQGIDRKSSYFRLVYDRDNFGLYIFVTSIATGVSTHLWYDTRTQGFWPLRFPDSHGPISALVWDGDAPEDRYLLLGGRDGILRKLSTAALDDDGTAITASLTLGPVTPFDDSVASRLIGTTLNMGEVEDADGIGAWNATATLQSGKTPYDVTEGTPTGIAAIPLPLDRRSKTIRQRLNGSWFTLKLDNSTADTYFAFESAALEFSQSGRNRRQR